MNTQETSKIFVKMGASVGIYNPKKSHRGIIAKRYMNKVERFEMVEFEKQMVKISPTENRIPIKSGGQIIGYL